MSADDAVATSAIRRHEERLERDPASLAFAPLADLYRRVGRTREAIDLCRQGLARYPQYTTARLILARALVSEGDLEQAHAELRTLLEANAQDVLSHRLAAEVERRRGRVDAAAEHLDAVVRLDPSDRESRALLAVLRAAPPPAEEPIGLARVLADDTFATATFGAVCLDQGLAEEAGQIFTRILRKDPDNARARTGLEGALKARLRRKG
jgi:tetratricopeptide (TPR) repeat protein